MVKIVWKRAQVFHTLDKEWRTRSSISIDSPGWPSIWLEVRRSRDGIGRLRGLSLNSGKVDGVAINALVHIHCSTL